MMRRAAYERVTIAFGGNVLELRPSLRAATILESRYGFPALYKALDECNLTIILEIILTVSTDRKDAAAFLFGHRGRPLSPFFAAVRQPLAELLAMFVPAPDRKAKSSTTPSTGKPMPFADLYAVLFERATGWIGWTPETAWNATPTEIDRTYAAHIEKLKAIHGSADDNDNGDQADHYTPERLKEIDELGYDPTFDLEGLNALRSKIISTRRA
jgi:hypothetical protein